MITIPTYDEARNRVLSGTFSHLDWFVVENEPGGIGEEKFRTELANVLDDVVKECHENGRGYFINLSEEEAAFQQWLNESPPTNDLVAAALMAIVFIVGAVLLLGVGGWMAQ